MTWTVNKAKKGLTMYRVIFLATTLWALPVQAMTLTEALNLSVDHDPAVPYSRATLEAEQQLGRQVSGTLLPTVTLDGAISRHENESESQFFGNFEEGYTSNSAGITARQPVLRLDWFARGRQADALDAQAEAGHLQRTMAHFVRVAERYFAVLVAQDGLTLARAEAKAIGESLADTRKRHEVGLVPGTDLKEAQARDDLAKARLILARQELSTAQDALDESTGNGYVVLPVLPENVTLPGLTPADIQVWVRKATAQNPKVLLAQEAVNVAQAQASTSSADLLPSIDAVASYRHDDSSESRVGSERNDARLGLELTVPIYQGGIKRAKSRESEARLRVAQADLDRVQAETQRQTRQQYRQLEAAYAQVRALELAVTSALAAQEATGHGYQAGTRTITDVLNARSAVISAQRDLSRTRYDLLLGRMQLKQLTAELAVEDFSLIDGLLRLPEVSPAESK